MKNLKEETINYLADCGKTKGDILWIGCEDFQIPMEEFWEMADIEYDNGFGAAHVPSDLIIVGSNWWLNRWEYDGSEGWEYHQTIIMPLETRHINSLFGEFWPTLIELVK